VQEHRTAWLTLASVVLGLGLATTIGYPIAAAEYSHERLPVWPLFLGIAAIVVGLLLFAALIWGWHLPGSRREEAAPPPSPAAGALLPPPSIARREQPEPRTVADVAMAIAIDQAEINREMRRLRAIEDDVQPFKTAALAIRNELRQAEMRLSDHAEGKPIEYAFSLNAWQEQGVRLSSRMDVYDAVSKATLALNHANDAYRFGTPDAAPLFQEEAEQLLDEVRDAIQTLTFAVS
jgi:hypothetical protein